MEDRYAKMDLTIAPNQSGVGEGWPRNRSSIGIPAKYMSIFSQAGHDIYSYCSTNDAGDESLVRLYE
jgi:hypothetical protein